MHGTKGFDSLRAKRAPANLFLRQNLSHFASSKPHDLTSNQMCPNVRFLYFQAILPMALRLQVDL